MTKESLIIFFLSIVTTKSMRCNSCIVLDWFSKEDKSLHIFERIVQSTVPHQIDLSTFDCPPLPLWKYDLHKCKCPSESPRDPTLKTPCLHLRWCADSTGFPWSLRKAAANPILCDCTCIHFRFQWRKELISGKSGLWNLSWMLLLEKLRWYCEHSTRECYGTSDGALEPGGPASESLISPFPVTSSFHDGGDDDRSIWIVTHAIVLDCVVDFQIYQ